MKITVKKSIQVDEEVEVEFPLFLHRDDYTEGWSYDYYVRINANGRMLKLQRTQRWVDSREIELEVSHIDLQIELAYFLNSYSPYPAEEFAIELLTFQKAVEEATL